MQEPLKGLPYIFLYWFNKEKVSHRRPSLVYSTCLWSDGTRLPAETLHSVTAQRKLNFWCAVSKKFILRDGLAEQVWNSHILDSNHPVIIRFFGVFSLGNHSEMKRGLRCHMSPQRQNPILLLRWSQSCIRSDHRQIKAHPDTSLPLFAGSWHSPGTWNDSAGGGGGWWMEEEKLRQKGREEWCERKWREEKWRREKRREGGGRKIYQAVKKGETYISVAQIHRAEQDEEDEKE